MKQHDRGSGRVVALATSMDEYLSLKHGGGKFSRALAELFRDRYGDDCSALVCNHSADAVLIMLNTPTIVIPLCQCHLTQMKEYYSELVEHLPEMTSEARAPLFDLEDVESLSVSQGFDGDEREVRDDDEPADSQNDADEH